ncbi:MAG: zinc ribbon domain-containing protein [Methanomassiliicoccaceae archaeon]|nr:zinc ribbon domain-containing protein [Methanomassiliicoccaceae archaeon]MCL2318270.1 zinc ribbon domain-containing protein [Methanomassiliicoccaceae archaeon]
MADQTQSITLDHQWERVFGAIEQAAQNVRGMHISSSDRTAKTITLTANPSARSWGENMNITLVPTDDGKTVMNISSATKIGIGFADFGKNKKNINSIVDEMKIILQKNDSGFQSKSPQNDSGGSASFCGNCGKKLDPGARFCGSCGFDTAGGAK